jgi:hypothetical protein
MIAVTTHEIPEVIPMVQGRGERMHLDTLSRQQNGTLCVLIDCQYFSQPLMLQIYTAVKLQSIK